MKMFRLRRNWALAKLFLIYVSLLLSSSLLVVDAQRFCDLTDEPIVQVTLNETTGRFQVIDIGNNNTSLRRRDDVEDEQQLSQEPKKIYNVRKCYCIGTSRRVRSSNSNGDDDDDDENSNSIEHNNIIKDDENNDDDNDINNNDVYCPMDNNFCIVPYSGFHFLPHRDVHRNNSFVGRDASSDTIDVDDIRCITLLGHRKFVRSIFPILLVWYSLFAALLICTTRGLHALGCCLSSVCKCWNEFLVEQLMMNHPNYVNFIIVQYLDRRRHDLHQIQQRQQQRQRRPLRTRRRRNGEQQQEQQQEQEQETTQQQREIMEELEQNEELRIPTQLALKTKVYRSNNNNTSSSLPRPIAEPDFTTDTLVNNNDNDNNAEYNVDNNDLDDNNTLDCVICHTEIMNGDRIGVLSCNHIMHVDCLKGWLVRRNVCPLCLTTNVATPQYTHNNNTNNNDNDEGFYDY